MRSLIDFFNHGILPFVGRSRELDRLERFFRESAEAHGLRAALVIGEAGTGKSRLVEELLPRIGAAGGLVVHTKLYPGTSTSIASLVAAALASSASARGLLKRPPEETLGSTITALQRLARLRPVMLVIEDIHLLAPESRAELVAFLEGIADETIALLCLARPADLAARGIIERYIVEELRIDGIERDEVRELWHYLFGSPLDDAALGALYNATAGTPLALRTALRAALKSGAIARDPLGHWRIAVAVDELAAVLEQSVTLLAEGMVAHLSLDERRAAIQLAALGEIFTREAAAILLDDSDRAIELLTFKGVLAPPLVTGAPLPPGGPSDYPPIAFIHTLLHRHLAELISPELDRLVRLVADAAPLYSTLPFELLTEHAGEQSRAADVPVDVVRRAIARALEVASALDRTTEWPLGMIVLTAAEALARSRAAEWSDEEDHELRIVMLASRLELMRRDNSGGTYQHLVDQLLEHTREPLPDELRHYRLAALRYRLQLERRRDVDECRRIWQEIDALVAAHPSLRATDAYLDFLEVSAKATGRDDDRDLIDRAESELNAILESDLDEGLRTEAFRRIAPNFLWRFSSAEGLAQRRRMLERLESLASADDISLPLKKAAFLQGTGHVDECLAVLDRLQPRLQDLGHVRQIHSSNLLRLYALGWRVERLADLETMCERLIAEAPPLMANWMRERAGVHLVRIGLLHNDPLWARSILDRYLGSERAESLLQDDTRVLLAVVEGRLADELRVLLDAGRIDAELAPVVRAALGDADESAESLRERIVALLAAPILTRDTITLAFNYLDVVELLGGRPEYRELVASLGEERRRLVLRMFEWLEQRNLASSIRPLLSLAGRHLDESDRDTWLERLDAIEQRQSLATRTSEPPKLLVSMLGSIEIRHVHEPPVRVRGARLRTLLGLLTADRMLARPLLPREFQRIASGGEDDPERARKTTSMGVLRLRETLGADAVSTEGETPTLNLQHVEVDLLVAHERLSQVARALEDRAWGLANRLLTAALAITRGRVPFPGLYDEFFEAAREDFEYALRTAIVDVARALLAEGDPAGAVETLTSGFESMPEDEEIAELLREALTRVGRRTDAERVRLRAEEA